MAALASLALLALLPATPVDGPDEALRDGILALDPAVLAGDARERARAMLRDDLRRRIDAANEASSAAWREIAGREAWERFRDARLERLRESLGVSVGDFESGDPPPARVTGVLAGDGHRVENLVIESRPGLWITANLYLPEPARESMPAIVMSHSHHRPKTEGELQDMGVTWSRAGCVVIVPDHLGHGERRQHPFRSEEDFPRSFRVSRQDYYFRYDAGIQLHLAGESLIGWLVHDLRRCVDHVLSVPGVDRERVILLGAVAGGGDPAAVAGALDRRITAVVPFNFGGPQPETEYPLPDDAERSFNYAGSGSWESTRNLRRSAADGFLPWVIVGAVAPRRLVHAHEFSWDRERDPVWRRYGRIWGFFGAGDRLAFAHGGGVLRGRPPEATHCTNIGRVHREMIHAAFRRWFAIDVGPEDERSARRDERELLCMTPEAERELRPRPLHAVVAGIARRRIEAARSELAGKPLAGRRRVLRERWGRLLGDVEPRGEPRATLVGTEAIPGAAVERIVLEVEPGITVPLLALVPAVAGSPDSAGGGERRPAVVAVAQSGKRAFLRGRAGEIAALLEAGVVVCLPDLRGTGESEENGDRGPFGAATARSSTELMLGGTLVGARLRDLRAVLRFLRGREDVDARRIALWGDSFSEPNAPGVDLAVPRRIDGRPRQSEPLGGLLALLGALFEEEVAAVAAGGGLAGFLDVLASGFVYVPHDIVVPGALTAGDLSDIAAALAPRPVRLERLVDGHNRVLGREPPEMGTFLISALR